MMNGTRAFVRDCVAFGLAVVHVTDNERWHRGRLTIATFHRVLPEEQRRLYPLPGLVVTPEELGWFLGYFARRFECGTLQESAARWRSGASMRPQLALTFDDGPLDNYVHACPVLDAYGFRASFYLPAAAIEDQRPLWHDALGFGAQRAIHKHGREATGEAIGMTFPASSPNDTIAAQIIRSAKHLSQVDRDKRLAVIEGLNGGPCIPEWAQLMSWDHARDLVNRGHEIGSHSMTHPLFPQCTSAQLGYEIGESRRLLQERVGASIDSLCYPNGDFDQRSSLVAQAAGYRWALTTQWGNNPPSTSPFELRRYDMNAEHSRSAFANMSASRTAMRLSGLNLVSR